MVAAVVETHGRARTAAQIGDLETVPPKLVDYRGTRMPELDVEAVLARRPALVLVDELAHTNTPGSKNHKRWQDVQELLEAGIDVLSTVNVQHLESLNDVVAHITGVVQQETVPDAVVRSAAQVELVDITPEALRRRLLTETCIHRNGSMRPWAITSDAETSRRYANWLCCGWPIRWTPHWRNTGPRTRSPIPGKRASVSSLP